MLPASASPDADPIRVSDEPADADERRERRLAVVIRIVVGVGILLVGIAIGQIASGTMTPRDWGDLAIIAVIVAIAGRLMVHVRLGTSRHTQSLTDVAMMAGFLVVGVPCLTLAVAAGIAVAKTSARIAPQRVAFNTAKDVIVVGVAGYAATLLGNAPPIVARLGALPVLVTIAVLIVVVDEALVIPVVALASGRRARDVFLHAWPVRLGTAAVRLVLLIGAGYLLRSDPRMLFSIPLIVLGLHLWHANRMQQLTDQLAWKRLARIVDMLATADEPTVRAIAVHGAAQLFSCDEVDLHFHDPSCTARLRRGDAHPTTYTGADEAPARPGMVVTAALDVPGGAELRLRFHRVVAFTEREQYTLRALAAALGTGLRKANAVSTAAQMANDQAHAAIHDQLTGLVNRRRLLEYGAEQRTGLIGLAVLDLKGFKRINEGLGQTVGDEVLRHVANTVSDTVRDTGLVARLGADQFAVLYPQIGASSAAIAKVRNLLGVIATPFSVDGVRLEVNATAGIAVGPSARVGGVEELLRRADVAMHHAKREEQPMSIYVRGRDTADVGRLALGADLAQAVARREFTTAFQPIVDLGTGMVLSAEALARWPHPRHGQLSPVRFLGAVERSGLLAAFTDQVLDQALGGAVRWRDAGFDVPVAVNVSPRSLLDPALPTSILNALSAWSLPPSALIIELTETLTLSQLEVVDDVLHALRDTGVMLALDDFGTGYSSLATIARVPVGELKIDRTFVNGMAGTTESAIIRSTIDLGRSLDLLVVAEGIENAAQHSQLWTLGCPAGQGHLFGRPMPLAQFLARLAEGQDGVPGRLADPLHQPGEVRRLPRRRSGD